MDCFEVTLTEPFLSQGNARYVSVGCDALDTLLKHALSPLDAVSHCLTDASTRGVALVPKLALDVGSCEVLRVLQLTDNFIVPISYQVPRKVKKIIFNLFK